jgi:hypothetical protein
VGGIPKKVNKDEIKEEMEKVTEGVVNVIVYPSASDKTKNRGLIGFLCVWMILCI